jgi:hypothetical protein
MSQLKMTGAFPYKRLLWNVIATQETERLLMKENAFNNNNCSHCSAQGGGGALMLCSAWGSVAYLRSFGFKTGSFDKAMILSR